MIHYVRTNIKGLIIMSEQLDSRKHFRFPVYDDSQGVKIKTGKERVLFADEFDDYQGFSQTNSTEVATEELVLEKKEHAPTFPDVAAEREAQMYEPKPPQPLNRPDYSYNSPAQREKLTQDIQGQDKYRPATQLDLASQPLEVRRSIFKTDHQSSWEKKLETEERNDKAQANTANKKYNGRNYFVPKHIPASTVINHEEEDYSRDELTTRLKKSKSSYLIMAEEEDLPFQNEEITKKEITDFETKQEDVKTPFIRRDLNQLKRDEEGVVPAITRKRAKKKENTEQRQGRLEKSLSGIIEEESAVDRSNRYFD